MPGKEGHRNLPNVIVTYIAMRSNRPEVDAFLALMKDVGVDGVRIMNSDPLSHLRARTETHNGFRFVYRDEALSYQELEEFVERAGEAGNTKVSPTARRDRRRM